ncbi:MAG TPA: hypothetical protein VH120_08815, partial [Gemmataceae bacterium]|nr:hypothetical protein [Gemmataceae bacterium]
MKSIIQIVALVVVLVGGVFGVTFLTQFVRKPAATAQTGTTQPATLKQLLKSVENRPEWGRLLGIPGYQSMEMEKGVKRHYEFLVSNLTDKPVTVYLNSQFSCTCTRLKVLIGMV